jgi:predicted DNA-binding transcriptional regulator AlpA
VSNIKNPNTEKPERYVTEKEAAAIDGMSLAWHQKRRWEGNGPPVCKIGRSVRYPLNELLAWFETRKRA